MKARLLLPALVILALAPFPARAASLTVEVRSTEFAPAALVAAAGDEVTWEVTSGTHTVTAWEGAAFDSDILVPGNTFTTVFAGGTVRYRCEVHSSISAESKCVGMCGVVTSSPPVLTPPAFTYPAQGQVIEAPTSWVRGTAAANVRWVRVHEGPAILTYLDVTGGTWERELPFQNGAHTLTVVGIHEDGWESAASSPLTFTIKLPDTKAPVVLMNGPRNPIELNPLKIAGRADDDVVVASLQVEVTDLLGRVYSPPVTCDGCGTRSAKFNAQMPVLPGRYTVTVRAFDLAGHVGSATRDVIMI